MLDEKAQSCPISLKPSVFKHMDARAKHFGCTRSEYIRALSSVDDILEFFRAKGISPHELARDLESKISGA